MGERLHDVNDVWYDMLFRVVPLGRRYKRRRTKNPEYAALYSLLSVVS